MELYLFQESMNGGLGLYDIICCCTPQVVAAEDQRVQRPVVDVDIDIADKKETIKETDWDLSFYLSFRDGTQSTAHITNDSIRQ